MAKAAILHVLESTIGRYVKNLDAESLNVAVWAGKIELNTLALDVDNINRELARQAVEAPNLALPFRLLEGTFQSLSVDIPWTRITNRPVILHASGLNVLIEPYDHVAASATTTPKDNESEREKKNKSGTNKNEKKKKDERQQSILYAEEARQRGIAIRALTDTNEVNGMENGKGDNSGFAGNLVRRIIENLQIEIDGVHLKVQGQGYNAGVVLDHFSVVTTDEHGNQTFIDRGSNPNTMQKSFLFKSLKLKGFGIYCDGDTMSSVMVVPSQKSGKFSSTPIVPLKLSLILDKPLMQDKSFILAPLSFEATLRQSDCANCVEFPKYTLSTQLNCVSLVLHRTQLEIISNIARDLSSKKHASRLLFPEYRPSFPIQKGTTKLWWKYAVRCIGRINRRRLWAELMIAFRKRKVYVQFYKRLVHHASCSWLSPLNIVEKSTLSTIEADKTISVSGIMNWRNMADAQFKFEKRKNEASERPDQAAPSPPNISYFSYLFGTKQEIEAKSGETVLKDDRGKINDPPISLTPEEMKELESIVFDASTENDRLSKDSILYDLKFTLVSFKVDLITFDHQPLASLEMGTVSASFVANADGSFLSNFLLSSLNIHDRITPQSVFPLVVRSLQASTDLQSKFAHAFEFKLQKESNGDQDLIANIVSFEIVASPILLTEILNFITFEENIESQHQSTRSPTSEETKNDGEDVFYDTAVTDVFTPLGDAVEHSLFKEANSTPRFESFTSALADAWGNTVEKETIWAISIEIHAPILVLPKSCVDPMATTLVMNLGDFCLTFGRGNTCSDVQIWFDKQPKIGNTSTKVNNCMLKMENLSFMIAKANDKDWIYSNLTSAESPIKSEVIIEPIAFSLNIGIESRKSDKSLARKCIYGVLPAIDFKLSVSQITRIFSVINTWEKVIASVTSRPGVLISEYMNKKEDVIGALNSVSSSLKKHSIVEEGRTDEQHDMIDRFHFSISLHNLSMKISDDYEENIEALLVCATISCTQRTDCLTVDVAIDSPQVVLIPSIISELMFFFKQTFLPAEEQTGKVIPSAMETCTEVLENEESAEDSIFDSTLQKPNSFMINFRSSDGKFVVINKDCLPTENAISFPPSGDSVDIIVLKGQVEGKVKIGTDTLNAKEILVEVHGETEVFTAEEEALTFPVQILNPLSFSSSFQTQMLKGSEVINISFVTLSEVEMSLSIKNVALVMEICSSLNEAFAQNTHTEDSLESSEILRMLSDGEAAAIENLAYDLQRTSLLGKSFAKLETISNVEPAFDTQTFHSNANSIETRNIILSVAFPNIIITMINDLQGCDEALFKVMVTSCVCGADFSIENHQDSKPTFSIRFDTRVHSDFFDSQSNTWEPFLIEPWQLNVQATRGNNSQFESSRLATTVDIECHPCKISFSEQFLVHLGVAKSMWSVFDSSTKNTDLLISSKKGDAEISHMKPSNNISSMKRSVARSVRRLATSMPYALENKCGITVSFEVGGKRKQVGTDNMHWFSFDLPQKGGIGGFRAYGKDSKQCKSIKIYVSEHEIYIQNIDKEISKGKRAHRLATDGLHVFSQIIKIENTTIVRLSSPISLNNETSLDIMISLKLNDNIDDIGTCRRKTSEKFLSSKNISPKIERTQVIGIPLSSLQTAHCDNMTKRSRASLIISPMLNLSGMTGEIELPSFHKMEVESQSLKNFALPCIFRDQGTRSDEISSTMILQITRKRILVDGIYPFFEFTLQPRTIFCNNMYINIEVRTSMPHTYSGSMQQEYVQSKKSTIHSVAPFGAIELYTPGPVVTVSIKCADSPVTGGITTWNAEGPLHIPLDTTHTPKEHVEGVFPFVDESGTPIGVVGSNFYVSTSLNSRDAQSKSVPGLPSCSYGGPKKIFFSVYNIGVDHTGDMLFLKGDQAHDKPPVLGQKRKNKSLHPLSAFSSSNHKYRTTILPKSSDKICLLQLTNETDEPRCSHPFRIQDIPFCEGGLHSVPIKYAHKKIYAYRRLSLTDQDEVHIIPEFVVFNGGNEAVRIAQPGAKDFLLESGKIGSISRPEDKNPPLIMIIHFLHKNSCTDPIRVDTLGMQVCVIKSSGNPVGSVPIQTSIGSKDSRFVVKVGEMTCVIKPDKPAFVNMFGDDYFRIRLRWAQLEVELQDASTQNMDSLNSTDKKASSEKVAHVSFEKFTIGFQRVFEKSIEATPHRTAKDTAQTQLAVSINNIRITDCTEKEEKVVLQSSDTNVDFINFCMRTRGSIESGLTCVDLLDLKIAQDEKVEGILEIKLKETFVERILDMTSRTQHAISEMSSGSLVIDWDEGSNAFAVIPVKMSQGDLFCSENDVEYCPPRIDQLYAVRMACVSPISLLVSFKRNTSQQNLDTRRGNFAEELKFSVKEAKLKFKRYKVENVNGPSDHIIELFTAHYVNQMKRKLITLVKATSMDDWKMLTERTGGAEDFVEGDILRVTGTMVGRSAEFILKKTGETISKGITVSTSKTGDIIENASDAIGLGLLGHGVNKVLSGTGGVVGKGFEAAGKGSGGIFKFSGKGAGKIVGGVSGGVQKTAKGIARAPSKTISFFARRKAIEAGKAIESGEVEKVIESDEVDKIDDVNESK